VVVAAAAGFWPLGADEPARVPGVVAALKGHIDAVYSVAFSPDGKSLVTGSFDNTLKLWDVPGGREIKTFGGPQGHQKMVLSVAFSPDGHAIASGGADNTAKVWDVPSAHPLRSLIDSDAINGLALSPDGTRLAVAGKDGAVKVYSAADFKLLFELKGHSGPVTGVAFSGNGQTLASSGSDRTVRFWNLANGQPLAVLGAHTSAVNAVLFHPNNVLACSAGDDGLLKFWQMPPSPPRAMPVHNEAVTAVALSTDGSQVLSASSDRTVRAAAFVNGQPIRQLTGPAAAVRCLAVSGNHAFIAAGTDDRQLFLWNGNDGKLLGQSVAHGGPVTGVSVNAQNTQVLTAGQDGLLKVWALPPVPARVLSHPDAVLAALPSPDGKRLFTGGADKILRSWDIARNAVERQFTGHTAPVTAVALSANGQVLASGGADATIRFWNQAMGKETEALGAHGGPVTALAFNPTATQVLSCSADATVKLWQVPPPPARPFVHPDQVTSVALSPDGTKLLTGCADKTARLWNLTSGARERDFTGHALAITSVAFSGDGQRVAAGGADRSLLIWGSGDAKIQHQLTVPAPVPALAFSPDGKFVAAGLADGSIRLFDAAAGKEVKHLPGHKGPVTGLVYTPKGDQLVSAGADRMVQLWSTADGALTSKREQAAPVTALALSKDGSRVAAGAGKAVHLWTLVGGKAVITLPTPAEVRGVSFSPDGGRLVVAGTDGRARVYGADGKLVEFFTHDGPVLAVAFADARRIISASADKTARASTLALLWQQAHAGPVRQAVFTPKGDQVISAGDDKMVRMWNAGDGKAVKALTAHDGPVVGVSLSADGGRLATAGADKSVKVWSLTPARPEEKGADKTVASFTLDAPAQSVTLSPSGQRVAVAVGAARNSPVHVFDVALGKELLAFPEHTGAVHSLAFLGDNRTLVSASADRTVRLSDVGVLTVLPAHAGGVAAVQFHANGTQALSGGADRTVKLWDLAKGTVLKTFGPLADAVSAVAFSRDFTQLGAGAGKTIKVWNIADGKELLTLVHPADVTALSFSPDKTKIATGAADKLMRVWDLATGKELQFFPQADVVRSVLFHNNNTSVLSGAGKAATVDTLALVRLVPASAGPIHALAVTPGGSHVLTAGADKMVQLWNAANGARERTLAGAGDALHAVAVSKNNVLVATGGADRTVRVYTFADGKEVKSVSAPGPIRSLTFSPNNLILAASSADGSVNAWSVAFNPGQPPPPNFLKPLQSFTHAGPATGLALAPDNATLYSGGLDRSLRAWKLAAEAPTKNFPHPNLVDAVAFDPAGTRLATGSHDGKVRIYDLIKGTVLKEIAAHAVKDATMIYGVAWSPDGKQVVSASYDNSLKLWDATSGALVREFKAYKMKEFEKGHRESVFSVAFSPDGKRLASGSGGLERVIKIWNVADGAVLRDLDNPKLKHTHPEAQSHPGWVYSLRYTRDGKRLVSAGDAPLNKGYVAIWDPDHGKLLYGEEMALGTFYAVALSPDENLLAVAAGPRGRPTADFNSAYLFKMPMLVK
jgi:WD40 repeat protein